MKIYYLLQILYKGEIELKIGLHLTLEYKQAGKKTEKYKSKIIEKTKDEIIIDYPVHTTTMKTEFFSLGTVFSANYIAEDTYVYQFPTQIKRTVKLNVPGLALSLPDKDKVKRIQRRQFVRVDAAVDLAIHSKAENEKKFTTVTTDISGGGSSIIISDPSQFSLGETLDIWIALPFKSGDIQYAHTKAEIVFIQSRSNIHTISVKFLSLKSKEQQLIIRYCFEKQLESRKKEIT